MTTESNKRFLGYQAWQGPSDEYVNGAWLDLQLGAEQVRRRLGSKYIKKGKVYFEFNLRGEMGTNIKYRAGVTNKTLNESAFDDLLGSSDKDWVFDTREGDYYHNNIVSTGGLAAYSNLASDSTSGKGVFYSSLADTLYDSWVLRIAIDLDQGKLWFGIGIGGGLQYWDGGNPSAGTGQNYTFTANIILVPCLSIVNTNASFDQRGIAQLLTTQDTCRCNIPSGFTYLDSQVSYHQEEILLDTPIGYWMASPFDYQDGQILNNMGVPVRAIDSSGGDNRAQYYNQAHYISGSGAVRSGFPAQPRWMLQQAQYNAINSFPCLLGSNISFTVEATIYIYGPGREDVGDTSYKGGSFLVCRDFLASQYNAITQSDLWFGLSLRGRRLMFGVGTTEAVSNSDLSDGLYHIFGELDFPNLTVRLYINDQLEAETSGYSDPSGVTFYINIGSRRPYAVDGNFPGYFRDIAVYDKLLTSVRKTAHFNQLNTRYSLFDDVNAARDNLEAVTPSHIQ